MCDMYSCGLIDIAVFACERQFTLPPPAHDNHSLAGNMSSVSHRDHITAAALLRPCKKYMSTQWYNAKVTGLAILLWLSVLSLVFNGVFTVITTRCAHRRGTFRKRGECGQQSGVHYLCSPVLPAALHQRHARHPRLLPARRALHERIQHAHTPEAAHRIPAARVGHLRCVRRGHHLRDVVVDEVRSCAV